MLRAVKLWGGVSHFGCEMGHGCRPERRWDWWMLLSLEVVVMKWCDVSFRPRDWVWLPA